mgnify:CR=1 FL=1
MTNDYQQERLAQMMAQMPQHKGMEYDDVVATVDFTVSDHPNPKKARKKNIKKAIMIDVCGSNSKPCCFDFIFLNIGQASGDGFFRKFSKTMVYQ